MQPKREMIIKDGQVVKDEWQWALDLEAGAPLPEGKLVISLAQFQVAQESLQSRSDLGVCIPNDAPLNEIASSLSQRPLIAIDFPSFMDGRGFSLARLLRQRYGFKGELRATGHVIRDQLCYLKRCGFNAFSIEDEDVDLEKALASLNDFSDGYQTSVDVEQPVFRRRA